MEKLFLSSNKIKEITKHMLVGLERLHLLDVVHNEIVFINRDFMAEGYQNILFISSEKDFFCCFGPQVQCSVMSTKSCGHNLPKAVSFMLWSFGFIGISTSGISLVANARKLIHHPHVNKTTSKTYKYVTLVIILSSLLLFQTFLCITTLDSIYGDSYKYNKIVQQSLVCHLICLLFLFASFSNIVFVTVLALVRFWIVHYPFKAKLAATSTMRDILLRIFVLLVICSISITTLLSIFNNNVIMSHVCIPVSPHKGVIWNKVVAIFLICLAVLCSISLPILYCKIFLKVRRQKTLMTLIGASKQTDKVALKAILASIFTFLTWIPTSMVFIATQVVEKQEKTEDLLSWTIALVLPIAFLAYPLLLSEDVLKFVQRYTCFSKIAHRNPPG